MLFFWLETTQPEALNTHIFVAVFLVNGKAIQPLTSLGEDIQTLKVRSGTPIRLRLINAANARFFRFSIPNHNFFHIGGDGGLLSTPIEKLPIPLLFNS